MEIDTANVGVVTSDDPLADEIRNTNLAYFDFEQRKNGARQTESDYRPQIGSPSRPLK